MGPTTQQRIFRETCDADLPALCKAFEAGRYPCLKASAADLFRAAGQEALAKRFTAAVPSG